MTTYTPTLLNSRDNSYPELFKRISKEIEQKKKEGKSEMAAAMEVMRKHQGEIQKLMQN